MCGKVTVTVDQYMRTLEHPRKAEIEMLRQLILNCGPGVTEQIKWNAPSFCFRGDDRVTFRLQPRNRLQVVLHRGARAKPAAGFSFDDPEGMIEWLSADRGIITFRDEADFTERGAAVAKLAYRWMLATD